LFLSAWFVSYCTILEVLNISFNLFSNTVIGVIGLKYLITIRQNKKINKK
jgi:hypothetical protein